MNNFSNFKKGDKVKMTFGCYDDYEGTIIKNLKYKLIISTTILNKKVHIETRDFLKQSIRSLEHLKKDFDEDGFCNCCGWNSCYTDSHIIYCSYGNCEYIKKMYGEKTLKDLFDEEHN